MASASTAGLITVLSSQFSVKTSYTTAKEARLLLFLRTENRELGTKIGNSCKILEASTVHRFCAC
jgi:hypothetical protein